ncbi:uncharacterized protein LOC117654210 isoform X2 [Thrips palmi]|uniref:Uncharacterized protein LOC117654210 isoform X2 n=1 Tax=Thrips palmi TaxID=161013 RepID=A0A6P9ALG2_THRPL|nr:uncharacterized protein LOC117654210 isoform X2 [Thrips palmi]XP_034256357.1 uncharacterized protein LOC117654210 isoform X2 [Thrips palmi]
MRTHCFAAVVVALAELLPHLHAISRNYDLVFENVESIHDHDYFSQQSGLFMRPLNTTDKPPRSEVSAILDIIKPLPNNSLVDVSLLELYEKRYIQSFVKYRTPLCDYLRLEKKPVFSAFKTYYHFPASCPLQGFYRMDWNSRFEEITPPIFPGPENWKLVIQYASDSHNILKQTIKFRVDRTKAKAGRG